MAAMAMVAAAVLQAVGSISSANSAKNAANYNATLATQRQTVALQQGAANEDAQRRQAGQVLGRQASGAADSTGLSGTAIDNYQQSATNAEIDALNIRYGAQLGALSAGDEAALSRAQASNAMKAGYLNAGAAALSAYGNYGQTGRIRGGGPTGPGGL